MKKIALLTFILLGSCSQQEPKPFPSSSKSEAAPKKSGFPRDFKDVLSADASVPPEIKIDYQLLINCQDSLALRQGKEMLPMSIDRVADAVDALTENPNAAAQCSAFLNGKKTEEGDPGITGRVSRESVMTDEQPVSQE